MAPPTILSSPNMEFSSSRPTPKSKKPTDMPISHAKIVLIGPRLNDFIFVVGSSAIGEANVMLTQQKKPRYPS